MDSDYTEAQRSIRKLVRDFAQRELAPGAEERDRSCQPAYDQYRRLGELGVTGLRFPEAYGGSNGDFLSWCLALEEVSRVDLSFGNMLFSGPREAYRIVKLGTEEQKRKWREEWIVPVARGEATTAGALSEPQGGSDLKAVQTTAVRDGNEWVLNGTKVFITSAGLKTTIFVSVLALTDREKRQFDTIIVPTGTPGFTLMPPYRTMGVRSSDTRELVFEECRVPAENLLGERGTGHQRTLELLAEGRIQVASTALGLEEACLEESSKYARQRVAFGRTISKFQYIQGMLVDMALEVELCRLLRDKAARLVDQGRPFIKEAAMVKYFGCEAAKRAADSAVQIFGGLGYMDECAVSRYYRDAKMLTIGEGTTEIQKYVIARELGC